MSDTPTPARPTDEYGRAIFTDSETPDPFDPSSRFAQWHGRTCGPWTVITVLEKDHRTVCDRGWTRNLAWSYVCGRCHPDAVDKPGTSEHQIRPSSPVDSPEADTPNPGPTARQVIARTLLDHWGPTFPQDECDCCTAEVLAALAAAGLRVVQVPDGLPERLRQIADGVGAFGPDLRVAAALLAGEER